MPLSSQNVKASAFWEHFSGERGKTGCPPPPHFPTYDDNSPLILSASSSENTAGSANMITRIRAKASNLRHLFLGIRYSNHPAIATVQKMIGNG